MELVKLKKDEIKGFDKARLAEVEKDIRREMAMIRMDLYSDKRQHAGKVASLRKSLARVLTRRNELLRNQSN